jgi:hypothetical protein
LKSTSCQTKLLNRFLKDLAKTRRSRRNLGFRKEDREKKFDKEDGEFWAYVNKNVQFKLGLAHKKMSFKDSQEKDKK